MSITSSDIVACHEGRTRGCETCARSTSTQWRFSRRPTSLPARKPRRCVVAPPARTELLSRERPRSSGLDLGPELMLCLGSPARRRQRHARCRRTAEHGVGPAAEPSGGHRGPAQWCRPLQPAERVAARGLPLPRADRERNLRLPGQPRAAQAVRRRAGRVSCFARCLISISLNGRRPRAGS